MTGLLGLTLPAFGTPMIIGAVALTLAAGAGGAWIDHRLMAANVANAKLETAGVQASYASYKAAVAANAAKATAIALQQTNSLNQLINSLQGQLAEQQKADDARSKELLRRLNNAKPGDVRALGPNVLDYVARLRGP